ncbi:hypothetical protein E2C01_048289 [Portunus trituberculatus]|uniref:Uncharacterized protein n=1 Tax=Portunus trituberculatus TaxID=210409 RepID=A0A5B7GB65_PORTR|nr:hypothetical protein [Portunus trituberculatus]
MVRLKEKVDEVYGVVGEQRERRNKKRRGGGARVPLTFSEKKTLEHRKASVRGVVAPAARASFYTYFQYASRPVVDAAVKRQS